jgi:hypothetical protein
MWRTVAIVLLAGLLLGSTGANVVLLTQLRSSQSEASQLRQRALSAEQDRATLQNQLANAGAPTSTTPSTPSAPAPSVNATPGATAGPDQALLQRIQQQVSQLRGLTPKSSVPLRFLDQQGLNQHLVQNFDRDYLPNERESDQKLLSVLGVLNQGDNVVQILLDLLTEQVVGTYSADDKVMYLVSGAGSWFGPDEQVTFAHEFTHALQDQYYDLNKLMPKHSDNDDRSEAVQALVEGDAVLIQRLWAQSALSPTDLAQLGQSGGDSKLFQAPNFIREQLLFPYGDGFNFVRQTYQAGGTRAVDELFRNPPESTEQLIHPDKYRAHEKPVPVSVPDLSGSLGQGWRQINQNTLGEMAIRLTLEEYTDANRAARAAAGWGGDRWALLEKDDRQALVLETVWDTQADAREFFDTESLALKSRFSGAKQDEASDTRQALTAATNATDVRLNGSSVQVVISFDRPSADAIVALLPSR